MKCVVYRGTGGREVITIENRPDPAPGRFEVLIAPTFSGLNPADVLQREGKHPAPAGSPGDVPGLEVEGTIVAIGDEQLHEPPEHPVNDGSGHLPIVPATTRTTSHRVLGTHTSEPGR